MKAYKIARLEAKRLFNVLYDHLHPDAREIIPEEVIVGWYTREFSDKVTGEPEIRDIEFGEWTWDVTGQTYDNAAMVTYVQPVVVDGEPSEIEINLHLAKYRTSWGWFFGESQEWLDEQIAYFTADLDGDGVGPSPFKNRLDADVDRFWARQFAEAGREYLPPLGVIGFNDYLMTTCGEANPEEMNAFYCSLDETVYYGVDFRNMIEGEMGDFAWVNVIAHEWGHHIQDQLDIKWSFRPDVSGELSYMQMELQADCMAGAYTADAQARGWLDVGDIDEALSLTEWAGDPPGVPIDAIGAHGSGEQRIQSFRHGFKGGITACNVNLSE
jgi:hypothetical protein